MLQVQMTLFQCECTSNSNNKFQNATKTQQAQKPTMEINFAKTKQATICSQQENCCSRHPNQ